MNDSHVPFITSSAILGIFGYKWKIRSPSSAAEPKIQSEAPLELIGWFNKASVLHQISKDPNVVSS